MSIKLLRTRRDPKPKSNNVFQMLVNYSLSVSAKSVSRSEAAELEDGVDGQRREHDPRLDLQ
jgi:hypothetical protein